MAMPTMVAVDARLRTVGDEIDGHPQRPGLRRQRDRDRARRAATPPRPSRPWRPPANGARRARHRRLGSGPYEVVLTDGDDAEVARVSVLPSRPARPARAVDRHSATLRAGRADRGLLEQRPANRWDWLGVYKASASDPADDDYLIWDYSAGTLRPAPSRRRTDGEATLGPESQGAPWPLPPGDYVVHYLLADQYESAGSAEFSVRGGGD